MGLSLVEMEPTARVIVAEVLGIKPGEKVCILTDTAQPLSITRLLAAASRAAGAEAVVVTIAPREVGGMDPPLPAAAALQAADVVIAQASYSIVHTQTVREALRRGARVCDMWGFSEDMMVEGGATADYREVRELSRRLARVLSSAKEARLTTKEGSDLICSLEGREAHALGALATEPGQFCAFPDGEAAISPVEGSAEGTLVNPFSIEKAGIGFLKEGLSLKVEGGKVVAIEGGGVASQLLEFLEPMGDSARNIAELAIGTNPKARLGVSLRETKKGWGTAHIALGDSRSLGGKVESPIHMDLVFREPTLVVDGQAVLSSGKGRSFSNMGSV